MHDLTETMKKSILIVVLVAFAFAAVVVWLQLRRPAVETGARVESVRVSERPDGSPRMRKRLPTLRPAAATGKTDSHSSADTPRDLESADSEESQSAPDEQTASEESAAVRAERKVTRFYAEVDRWTRERPVRVEDVQEFVRTFTAIPPPLRKGSVHRALNLIPDANVALLAGVLLDKSQPTEVVREVFNDIVNRSEEVKKPILKEIAKDKTHPCCSDAEWIFEVTGEKPE